MHELTRSCPDPRFAVLVAPAGPSRVPFIAKPASRAQHARMMRHRSAALLGLAALALSACATPVPPVEVTRFHSAAVAGWAPGTRYVVDPRPLAAPAGAASGIPPSPERDTFPPAVQGHVQSSG